MSPILLNCKRNTAIHAPNAKQLKQLIQDFSIKRFHHNLYEKSAKSNKEILREVATTRGFSLDKVLAALKENNPKIYAKLF